MAKKKLQIAGEIRNRVKELRFMKASELIPHPQNWRKHPDKQREGLLGSLKEIGFADALLAFETPSGLQLIDGHLRAETAPDTTVPVLVLDLDEREAKILLATLDPLASMASTDTEALQLLVDSITPTHEEMAGLLAEIAPLSPPTEEELAETDILMTWGVVIECENEEQQLQLLARFNEEGLKCRALM